MSVSVKFYSLSVSPGTAGDTFDYEGSCQLENLSHVALQAGAQMLNCWFGPCLAVCDELQQAKTFTREAR